MNQSKPPLSEIAKFRGLAEGFARGYAARLAIRHWIAPRVLRCYYDVQARAAAEASAGASRRPAPFEPTRVHAEKYTFRLLERLIPLTERCQDGDARVPRELLDLTKSLLWPRPVDEPITVGRYSAPGLTCVIRWKYHGKAAIGPEPVVTFPYQDEDDVPTGRATGQTDTPFCLRTRERYLPNDGSWAEEELSIVDTDPFVTHEEFTNLTYRKGPGTTARELRIRALRLGGYHRDTPCSLDKVEGEQRDGQILFDSDELTEIIADLADAGRAVLDLHELAGLADTLVHQWMKWRRLGVDKELASNVDYLFNISSQRPKKAHEVATWQAERQAMADTLQAGLVRQFATALPFEWKYANQLYRWNSLLDLTAAAELRWKTCPPDRRRDPDEVDKDDLNWLLGDQRRRKIDIYLGGRRESVRRPKDLFAEAYLRSISQSKPSERLLCGTIQGFQADRRTLSVLLDEGGTSRQAEFTVDDDTKIRFASRLGVPTGRRDQELDGLARRGPGEHTSIRADQSGLVRRLRVGFGPDPRTVGATVQRVDGGSGSQAITDDRRKHLRDPECHNEPPSEPKSQDPEIDLDLLLADIGDVSLELLEMLAKAALLALGHKDCRRFLRLGPISTERGRPPEVEERERLDVQAWNSVYLIDRFKLAEGSDALATRLNESIEHPDKPEPTSGPEAYAGWLRAVARRLDSRLRHLDDLPPGGFDEASESVADAAKALIDLPMRPFLAFALLNLIAGLLGYVDTEEVVDEVANRLRHHSGSISNEIGRNDQMQLKNWVKTIGEALKVSYRNA